MQHIVVNGRPCTITPLDGRDVAPGMMVRQIDGRYGRRVYRVLCFDGDEVIARNVRNKGIIEALDRREVLDEFGLVEPA